MSSPFLEPLELTDEQRSTLETLGPATQERASLALRCRIVLLAATGKNNTMVSRNYNRSLCTRHIAGVPHRRYSCEMRPLRYSINVTLDGCCDHRAILADEDLHRHAAENLNQADALLFGRVTYEMMESAWRPPTPTGARPDWMEPFAQTINAAQKYVVSTPWSRSIGTRNSCRGDLGKAVQQLKRESGKGLLVGGVSSHWR